MTRAQKEMAPVSITFVSAAALAKSELTRPTRDGACFRAGPRVVRSDFVLSFCFDLALSSPLSFSTVFTYVLRFALLTGLTGLFLQ